MVNSKFKSSIMESSEVFGSYFQGKKILSLIFCVCAFGILTLFSCEDSVTIIKIPDVVTENNMHKIFLEDAFEIKVDPYSVVEGENIMVYVQNLGVKNLNIRMQSNSLVFDENVAISDTIVKLMDVVGVHDLNFICTYKDNGSNTTMRIPVLIKVESNAQ